MAKRKAKNRRPGPPPSSPGSNQQPDAGSEHTKQALLGELESIKDLLNEEEWSDIPTLSDEVDANLAETEVYSPEASRDATEVFRPQPSDEETGRFKPVPSQEATQVFTPPPSLEATQAFIPPQSEEATQLLDAAALNGVEAEITADDAFSSEDLEDLDIPLLDDPLAINTESEPDFETLKEAQLDRLEKKFFHHDENSADTEVPKEDLSDLEDLIDDAPREGPVSPGRVSPGTIDAVAPAVATGENLPNGVLPGQQSLFDAEEPPASPSNAAEIEAPPNAPEAAAPHAESPEVAVDDTDTNAARPQAKASGENPFLPKHIRDRLHTDKPLVDIIKDSPLPPPESSKPLTEHLHSEVKANLPEDIPESRLQSVVDEVIAIYLPKIEAELRERLLDELKKS
ncbi:hypothetical protein HBA55_18210 [Pseudomaricurvus alkylphenolicus]|uniref:hypothetical protein n=1 Tax=Pseudomaricurvus alkylphenolicus TaxID=1306991 RepID=UPI00141F7C37|nr:hypothetical protein [Pseudomaricurvus alkylphenolicus]NIB41543.1 hypothetical protein [Pseudomaricurvus alkylphenolicus]